MMKIDPEHPERLGSTLVLADLGFEDLPSQEELDSHKKDLAEAELARETTLARDANEAQKDAEKKYKKHRARVLELMAELYGTEKTSSFFNSWDNYTYDRRVSHKTVFNQEKFLKEHPELKLVLFSVSYDLDEDKVKSYAAAHPEIIKLLQDYTEQGDPTFTLVPRPLTAEEEEEKEAHGG